MKRKVFCITRKDSINPRPYVMYLTKSGMFSFAADRAITFKTEKSAWQEIEYFQRVYPMFRYYVDKL